MSDTDLRALEREADTGDTWARYRYRCALVRAGRAVEAGLEVGDMARVHWNAATREPLASVATGWRVVRLSGGWGWDGKFPVIENPEFGVRYPHTHLSHDPDRLEVVEPVKPVEVLR